MHFARLLVIHILCLTKTALLRAPACCCVHARRLVLQIIDVAEYDGEKQCRDRRLSRRVPTGCLRTCFFRFWGLDSAWKFSRWAPSVQLPASATSACLRRFACQFACVHHPSLLKLQINITLPVLRCPCVARGRWLLRKSRRCKNPLLV